MTNCPLDPEAILAALGIISARSTEPVSGGTDTRIWQVETAEAAYALRVFREEQVSTFEREIVAMRAATEGGIPVPPILGQCILDGQPALLLSWLDGCPLLQKVSTEPARAYELGVEFGRLQARIHSIAPPPALGSSADAWIEWAGPEEAELLNRLRGVADHPSSLLHLDYHPLNLMSGEAGLTVLDWANARAGDPRADFARTLTILRFVCQVLGDGDVWMRFESGWREGYGDVVERWKDMHLFYAWAGAVMVRDLRDKVGRPDFGLRNLDLDPVRQWTAHWKERG